MMTFNPTKPSHSLRPKDEYLFILGVSIIILTIFVMTGIFIYKSKTDREKQAEITTQNLTKELSGNISNVFHKADLILRFIADEYDRQMSRGGISREAMDKFIAKQKTLIERGLQLDGNVRITDKDGLVIYGTGLDSHTRVTLSDRLHFITPRNNQKQELFIGNPVLARMDKNWILPLALRLNKPDGSFAGVVVLGIDIKMFSDMIASLQLGSKGAISIRDRNMGIIARYPEPEGYGGSIGKTAISPEAAAIVKRGDKTGTFHVYSGVDRIERIYSFRMLPDYPIYTFVGIASSDYLSGWYEEVIRTVVSLLLLTGLIIFLSRQMFARWRNEIRSKEELKELNEDLERLVAERTAEMKNTSELLQKELIEHKKTMGRMRLITTAVESASDAIGISDAQGNHFYQNRALSELFGYKTAEELQSARGGFAVVKEPSVAREMFDHIMSGKPWSGELEMVAKDGRVIPAFERANAIKDEDGEVIGLIGIITDITERRRAEASLRESEEKYRALFNNERTAIYVFELDTWRLLDVNEAFVKLYGYSREELLGGMRLTDVSAEPEVTKSAVLEAYKQGSTFVPLRWHRKKDGTVFPIEVVGSGYSWKGQWLMFCIAQDITERKKAEKELQESEQRFRELAELLPETIFETDMQGNTTFANNNAFDRFGYTKEDFDRGVNVQDIIAPEALNHALGNIQKIINGEVLGWNEYTMLRKDGTTFPAIIYTMVIVRNGKPVGLRGLCIDIQKRKETDEALARVEKLEAIGTLAAGIAHDFNNLLGAMFGFLEISQAEAEKNKQGEIVTHLTKARSAFDRAKDLTGQLLTFSKGGAPVRKIQPLADHVCRTVTFSLSGSNVASEFDIQDDIWMSDFDEHQIAQVLDNIVINARQAMPQGGVLHVSMKNIQASEAPEMLEAKGYVCISIQDHGTGIAREHLSHIFDPFFTTKKMGSGLGLATSYSIVRQHDGLIDVDSEPGHGSTFRIYLPAASGKTAPVAVGQPESHSGKGRILIMDDEEMILDVLSRLLKDMGYEVEKTRHGKEAREMMMKELLDERRFVAAILDLTIPRGLGGKEIVYSLRSLDPKIKVIASSGYAHDPIMSNPADYGFAGRLTKPYRRSDLITVLGSVMPDSN